MTRHASVASQLQDIGSGFYAGKISRDEARAAVIDVVLDRLGCSRVSLWRFEGEHGALALLCFAAKRPGEPLDRRETRLEQAEFGPYFDALVRTGMYVTADAMADPALQPMRASYLVPNDVRSMLDAAVMVNGRAHGIVCCERDVVRRWPDADVVALRALVAKVALLMARNDDSALWSSPSVPLAPLPPVR